MQTETALCIDGGVTVVSVPDVKVADTPIFTPKLVANAAYFPLNATVHSVNKLLALYAFTLMICTNTLYIVHVVST